MLNKIERFAKGNFYYDDHYVILSETELNINVVAGKTYEGSFVVSNSAKRPMKCFLFCTSSIFTFPQTKFQSEECTVDYCINTNNANPGDIIKGMIQIVSDCGEQTLPFHVMIENPYCDTSIGKIKDLFQFANLAKVDWVEAKKVFRSEDFEQIFLKQDRKLRLIYRNLRKSSSVSQALEEFLITIRKKPGIKLSIDKTFLEYQVSTEGFFDKLLLSKDQWGYEEIRISTEAPFIQLEQKMVWTDQFIGNTYPISFVINPEELRPGNNFGSIIIKTARQSIKVDITCNYHNKDKIDRKQKIWNQFHRQMILNYLKFRKEGINLPNYMKETESLLHVCKELELSNEYFLLKTHLEIISGRFDKDKDILDISITRTPKEREEVLIYCAQLYLQALHKKEDESIQYATNTLRYYYENGYNDWRILWFLLCTDKRYDNKNLKLSHIKEQFDGGCHSPVLYLEAMDIFNEEPNLLRELSDFELQIMNYGIKHELIRKELATQYTYLANKKKRFHSIIYRSLVRLYEQYKTPEILTVICCTLIKGFKKEEKYFPWYRLGVEKQLRITELYEYYMYSVKDDTLESLPQPILLYFIYNSNINDRKKALLYAYIVQHKASLESIYLSYVKRMEVFARMQLEAHQMNKNLAVLYQEFFQKEINDQIGKDLSQVIFKHEITCENKNMVGVVVTHKEKEEEEYQTLNNGKAQISLYTQDAVVCLVDSNGNRFCVSVPFQVHRYMKTTEEYIIAGIKSMNYPPLQLHVLEKNQSYQVMNDITIELLKQVISIEGLKEEYYISNLMTLIDYYYENYDGDLLDLYLMKINVSKVQQKDRLKLLEYAVNRDLLLKAMEVLEQFCFESIPANRLLKICTRLIAKYEARVKKTTLLCLAHYIFLSGKYDERILKYLTRYYYGSTNELYQLWQAAKGFEINTQLLEERLLSQILFTESYVQNSYKVFQEYYKNVTNRTIVRGYLSFYAYRYLLHDVVVHNELFQMMKRELNYEENDLCMLALLKYYSEKPELMDSNVSYIDYHVSCLERKGLVLPFFTEFKRVIQLPERMKDKYYVEYKTNPKKQVYIHYRLLNNDSDLFITERMNNTILGIHVKEFVLFYKEILQYYITEEWEDEVNITESFHIHYDHQIDEEAEMKYNQINLMLMAKEMQEEQTLIELMENYARTEFIKSKCFKVLEE